jgi:hypothetical protein
MGTSTLTEPHRFTTGDKYITSAASLGKTAEILSVCFSISVTHCS